MDLAKDDEAIEALLPDPSHQPLHHGIFLGRPHAERLHRNPRRRHEGIQLLDEQAVADTQPILRLVSHVIEKQGPVAALLHHPGPIGIGRHPHAGDPAAAHREDEPNQPMHQPGPRARLVRDEVAGPPRSRRTLEELVPAALAPSRPRLPTVVLEDLDHPRAADRADTPLRWAMERDFEAIVVGSF